LKADTSAWCWGFEDHGSLGNGLNADSATPVPVTGMGTGVIQHLMMVNASYVVKSDGSVWGWGAVSGANLSQRYLMDPLSRRYGAREPVRIVGLDRMVVKQISSQDPWVCALTDGGQVWCWGLLPASAGTERQGSDVAVQLDLGPPGSAIIGIAAGANMLCVLGADGAVRCMGANDVGQLGDGTIVDRFILGAVADLPAPAARIVSGLDHACALLTDETLWCWGSNSHGQLGSNARATSTRPRKVTFVP
jgi:alpha-tubulin suppressor-like RCC1 family protein